MFSLCVYKILQHFAAFYKNVGIVVLRFLIFQRFKKLPQFHIKLGSLISVVALLLGMDII